MNDPGMPSPPSGSRPGSSSVTVVAVPGIREVAEGDDVAALVVDAMARDGIRLAVGDCLVISSKVASKALGLTWTGSREDAVAAGTVRVVAERWAEGRATQVVESVAGPVMAAAGVDASNTGPSSALLLLPEDPDAVAAQVRSDVLALLDLRPSTPFAVVLSDTAGRPWRSGLTDFALGSAGLRVLEDLRGAADHDGRPLSVTVRAIADEVAAAADLVKGKANGIPAAVVRGLDSSWFDSDGEGARRLVRTGAGDWFALGHVEAVRAALGAAPGTAAAREVGVASTSGADDLGVRVGRVVALALLEVPDGSADVGVVVEAPGVEASAVEAPGVEASAVEATGFEVTGVEVTGFEATGVEVTGFEATGVEVTGFEATAVEVAEITLAASNDYELGRLVTRLEVAAHSEDLRLAVRSRGATSVTVSLSPA